MRGTTLLRRLALGLATAAALLAAGCNNSPHPFGAERTNTLFYAFEERSPDEHRRLIAALAGFLFFPLSFEITISVLFAAGFAAIALSDYSRTTRPRMIPVGVRSSRKERGGLAA